MRNIFGAIVAGGLMLAAGQAEAQVRWDYNQDDGLAIGSADVIDGARLRAALRCHVGAGRAASHISRVAEPGILTLMLAPDLIAGAAAQPTTISVDGAPHLSVTFETAQPEGVPAAQILADSPLVQALASGARLEFSNAGGAAQLALRGSSRAIARLGSYCATALRPGSQVPRPGFDCRRAGTATERALCADPRLARLDASLNAAMALAVIRPGAESLRAEQQRWIQQRDRCGADASCLAMQMESRVAGLRAIAAGQTAPSVEVVPTVTAPSVPTFDAPRTAPNLAAAAPQMSGSDIKEMTQLQTALAVWLTGARPVAGARLIDSNVRPWLAAELPPGFPRMSSVDAIDRARVEAYRTAFLARAAQAGPPETVTLDLGVTLTDMPDGSFRLNLGFLANRGVPPAKVTALRTLGIAVPLMQNKGVTLTETRPFVLEVPDNLPGLRQQEQVTLRVDMRLSEAEIRMAPNTPRLPQELARARMEIRSAILMQGERVLHSWDRAAAAPDLAVFDMADPAGVAALYGGAVEQERLLLSALGMESRTGIPAENGHISQPGDTSLSRNAARFAMRLGTLMAQSSERPLSEELVRTGARLLLTPLERDTILPLTFQSGQMNEIEAAQVLAQAEPRIREIVAARMPRAPLNVRIVGNAMLGQYDGAGGGFALQGVQVNNLAWLRFPPTSAGMRALVEARLDFLPIGPDAASALLDKVETLRRQILVQLDYRIETQAVATGRSGPITQSELDTVRLQRVPQRVTFYADALRDAPLHEVVLSAANADTATAGDADVPQEVYRTTGATIMAKASELPGGALRLEDALRGRPEVVRATASRRDAILQGLAADIRSRAPERLWIGALLTMGDYDAARGGFEIVRHDLVPVAHEFDIDGIESPLLEPADDADYALLPVPQDQAKTVAALIEGVSLQAFFNVALTGEFSHRKLEISSPSVALLGPPSPWGGVTEVALRIEYPEAPVLAARETVPVDPPQVLRLTPEAVDLIVMRDAPDRLGEAGMARMLRDRLALERAARDAGQEPVWGAFFADPSVVEPEGGVTPALLAAFTDWTHARIADLPDRIVLPLTADGRTHPETGCVGLSELAAGRAGLAVAENYTRLLGAESEALQANFGSFNSSATPLPGPDRVFALRGRPGLDAKNQLCPAPALVAADPGAPYTDLVVVARGMPVFGALPGRLATADLALSDVSVRIEPLSPAAQDGQGLSAALVVDGTVSEVQIWTAPNFRAPPEQTVTLRQEDWQAATGNPAAALDIVGLTLGISRETFLSAAQGRLPDAIRFDAASTPPSQYGEAVALLDPTTREVLLAITAPGHEDGTVLAIARQLRFDPNTATGGALKATLEKKYGPVGREGEYGGRVLVWGAPSEQLDRYGICGGVDKFARGGRPEIRPADPAALPVGSSLGGAAFWDQLGWPLPERNEKARLGLPHCGPVVAAIIREGAEGTLLTVWLIDEAAARAIDAARAQMPAKALDLDL